MCQYVRVWFSGCGNVHELVFKVNPCAQYEEAYANDLQGPTVPWFPEHWDSVQDSCQFGEYP